MQAKAVSVIYVTQQKDPLIYYEVNGHFFHNLVISALRFPVSIITNDFLDFSWDDCNTHETLETTVTVCKIWGGKQGASRFWWKWSIHFNGRTSISLSFKKCDE